MISDGNWLDDIKEAIMKFLKPRLSEFAKMEYKYRPYVLDLIKQTKMGLMIEGKSVMTDLLKDVWRIIRGLDPESEQCMNFKVLFSFSNFLCSSIAKPFDCTIFYSSLA